LPHRSAQYLVGSSAFSLNLSDSLAIITVCSVQQFDCVERLLRIVAPIWRQPQFFVNFRKCRNRL